MNNYQLSKGTKEQEYNRVRQIMYNNKYNPSTRNTNIVKRAEKQGNKDAQNWAKFTHTRSVRKVSDRIFLCEHLMDYNLARLHEPTLNLSAHA